LAARCPASSIVQRARAWIRSWANCSATALDVHPDAEPTLLIRPIRSGARSQAGWPSRRHFRFSPGSRRPHPRRTRDSLAASSHEGRICSDHRLHGRIATPRLGRT
jgi:hypothetical protein